MEVVVGDGAPSLAILTKSGRFLLPLSLDPGSASIAFKPRLWLLQKPGGRSFAVPIEASSLAHSNLAQLTAGSSPIRTFFLS
jgi:hypothetical protein